MKNILKLSLAAALAAAFTTSASAFPYSQPHYGPVVLGNSPTKSHPTVAVYAQGRGVDRQGKTAASKTPMKAGKTAQGNQR